MTLELKGYFFAERDPIRQIYFNDNTKTDKNIYKKNVGKNGFRNMIQKGQAGNEDTNSARHLHPNLILWSNLIV